MCNQTVFAVMPFYWDLLLIKFHFLLMYLDVIASKVK